MVEAGMAETVPVGLCAVRSNPTGALATSCRGAGGLRLSSRSAASRSMALP
jgi:hypothetical protein